MPNLSIEGDKQKRTKKERIKLMIQLLDNKFGNKFPIYRNRGPRIVNHRNKKEL